MEFSHDLALQLIQSQEQFPVIFDDAWQWIGYSSKQAAKKKLSRNFEDGFDYSSKWMSVSHDKGSAASRTEQIQLTVDCFKMFSMMAGTERGKEVRRYFLECERELKVFKNEPDEVLSGDRGERRLQLEARAKSAFTAMVRNECALFTSLSIIKEEELWRDIVGSQGQPVFEDFFDYCEQIIGLKRSEAYTKVRAGNALRALVGVPEDWKPKSAVALYQLSRADEETRILVLSHLADEGNAPTAHNIKRAIQEVRAERIEDLENALDMDGATEAQEQDGAGKVFIKFSIAGSMKRPLERCAKTRQMSVSTFVANLVFRELREAQSINEAPDFDVPW